jgi:hypothetical protein
MEAVEYLQALEKVVKTSFGVMLNASDTFGYAEARCVVVDPADLGWVVPICSKYGWDGETACMAYIIGECPIRPHLTPRYYTALLEIIALNPEVHSED